MNARALTITLLLLAVAGCGDDDNAAGEGTSTTEEATTTTEPAGTEVTFDIVLTKPKLGAPVCDGKTCMYPLSRTGTTASGDFEGKTISAGAGSLSAAGGLAGTNYQIFIGDVAECGTGSVAWVDTVIGSADELVIEWRIIEGTGTGDLAGMTGGGTSDVTFAADNSGTGTSTGAIDCG